MSFCVMITSILFCCCFFVPGNNFRSYNEIIGRKKSNFDNWVILWTGAVKTYWTIQISANTDVEKICNTLTCIINVHAHLLDRNKI